MLSVDEGSSAIRVESVCGARGKGLEINIRQALAGQDGLVRDWGNGSKGFSRHDDSSYSKGLIARGPRKRAPLSYGGITHHKYPRRCRLTSRLRIVRD